MNVQLAMSEPLVTTVIPTFGRPDSLPQAVLSAFAAAGDLPSEVIVVPNGSDKSWKKSLTPFFHDTRLRIETISEANANAAREYGLRLARGHYVRFLDDDDELVSNASAQQAALLSTQNAEVCSGAIALLDSARVQFKVWNQPAISDLVEATLSPARVTAVHAHLFLRSCLSKYHWDPSVRLGQDTHFIHSLCRKRDWNWITTDKVVGTWIHHDGKRISTSRNASEHAKASFQFLVDTVDALIETGRFTPDRKKAAIAGLWSLIHEGFYDDPIYWTNHARKMLKHFPGSRPDIAPYTWPGCRHVPPLLTEWLLLPKRRLNRTARRWRHRHGRGKYILPP